MSTVKYSCSWTGISIAPLDNGTVKTAIGRDSNTVTRNDSVGVCTWQAGERWNVASENPGAEAGTNRPLRMQYSLLPTHNLAKAQP